MTTTLKKTEQERDEKVRVAEEVQKSLETSSRQSTAAVSKAEEETSALRKKIAELEKQLSELGSEKDGIAKRLAEANERVKESQEREQVTAKRLLEVAAESTSLREAIALAQKEHEESLSKLREHVHQADDALLHAQNEVEAEKAKAAALTKQLQSMNETSRIGNVSFFPLPPSLSFPRTE